MKETKKNFTKEYIEEIRQSIIDHMNRDYWTLGELDAHLTVSNLMRYGEKLWEELEKLTKKEAEWQRCDDAGVETFEQQLGSYDNDGEIHEFVWFYVSAPGKVFPIHHHEQPCEEPRTKEWYFFFAPGKRLIIKFCDEGEAHELVNENEGEMYVLSFKAKK